MSRFNHLQKKDKEIKYVYIMMDMKYIAHSNFRCLLVCSLQWPTCANQRLHRTIRPCHTTQDIQKLQPWFHHQYGMQSCKEGTELMQLFFLVMQHLDPHQVPVRKGLILLPIYHGEPDVLAMASVLSCKQKGLLRGCRER